MADTTFLTWPFFDARHREIPAALGGLCGVRRCCRLIDHEDADGTCRRLVAALGKAGWLQPVVPKAYGGRAENFDVRELCLVRETLARFDGLADFAFAMQGLGTGPITLFGTPARGALAEADHLPLVRGPAGTAGAAEVQRLEQVRLTGAVGTGDHGQPRPERRLRALVAAEVADGHALDAHGIRPRPSGNGGWDLIDERSAQIRR